MSRDGEEKREGATRIEFIQYIAMLANTGMQHLGKMMNPVTGKTERSLEGAAAIIDLLAVFEEKTRGNLSAEEARVMEEALSNLRLNYADEAGRPEKDRAGSGDGAREREKQEPPEEKRIIT